MWQKILDAINPKNWGVVKFFVTLFGPDITSYYDKKDFDLGVAGIVGGSIILYRGKDYIQGAIRKITGQWANHAGIYFGSGKRETVEAMPEGVRKCKMDKDLDADHQLIVFTKANMTVTELAMIKGYAYGACGKKYNVDGVADFIIDDGKSDDSTRFCSQLVADAFLSAGIKTSGKEPRKTSPGDIGNYLISDEAQANGWLLSDTWNITTANAIIALKIGVK